MSSNQWELYNIPYRFKDANIVRVNLAQKIDIGYSRVYERVKMFFKSPNDMGIYFFGVNGCGKTYTACAVLWRCPNKHNLTIYRDTLQGIIHNYTEGDTWRLDDVYYDAQVLLIEELGKELVVKTDFASPILEDLLKWRAENSKRTLYTANCDYEEVEHYYGDTVYSIIEGHSIGVNMPDFDFRHYIKNNVIKKLGG